MWPRSSSTTAVACILLILLVLMHLVLCSGRLLAGSSRARRRSRQWHVQAEIGWVCWLRCISRCVPSLVGLNWVEEGVAALVVVSGSGLRFPAFAGLDAPRDMFTTFAGGKWPRSSSIMAVARVFLVLLVFMHICCVPDDCRQALFRLATWNRSWHRATYHGGKHAFPLGVQLLDKVVHFRCYATTGAWGLTEQKTAGVPSCSSQTVVICPLL